MDAQAAAAVVAAFTGGVATVLTAWAVVVRARAGRTKRTPRPAPPPTPPPAPHSPAPTPTATESSPESAHVKVDEIGRLWKAVRDLRERVAELERRGR
jgi:hypothetical protein